MDTWNQLMQYMYEWKSGLTYFAIECRNDKRPFYDLGGR